MFKEKTTIVTGDYVANFRRMVDFFDDDGGYCHAKVEDFNPTKESCFNKSLASDSSFEAQVLSGQPLRRVKSDILGVDTPSIESYCETLEEPKE